MTQHVLAEASSIPPGERRVFAIDNREIAVFNIAGEFFAIHNRCPHEGAALCKGILVGLVESDEPGEYRFSRQGELLRCPWHAWEFDIRTGKSWFDPARTKVRSYATTRQRGDELQEGPYTLETFKVIADRDYLVVDL